MSDVRIALGQFSYATGANLGDGTSAGSGHVADVGSLSAASNDLILTLPTDDYTLNTGDTIGFSFTDANGDTVTVNDAVVQESSFTDGGAPNMSGILTAQGQDQNGNEIALVLDMNSSCFSAGTEYFDHDDTGNTTDIVFDKPVNMFYMGNYQDVDPNESDQNAENAEDLVGISASNTEHLQLVSLQPQDVHNGSDKTIYDNDVPGPALEKGDRVTYADPSTGNEVIVQTDSTMTYTADILLGDGSTIEVKVVVIQTANGDVFVTDYGKSKNGPLDNLNIQRITLKAVVNKGYSGWGDLQSVDGSRVVCFTSGTLIDTDRGAVHVEDLRAGDMVRTMDSGFQAVRWVGARQIAASELAANPNLCPIRVHAGALGEGLPERDLLVSPQHRILLRSKIALRMFDSDEVLSAAKHLTVLDGIEIASDVRDVIYVHFLCDRHEIVFAEGTPTESLYTGAQALKSVSAAARAEILALFPELYDRAPDQRPLPARPLLRGREARQLAIRHARNTKPLLWAR